MPLKSNADFLCETCGIRVIKYQAPSHGVPRFCSRTCRCKAFIGSKQTEEHISRRIKSGESHQNWKGDDITDRSGRSRALRLFTDIGPCVVCGDLKAERHHEDGNTRNNTPENIKAMCRKCHMSSDGRLDAAIARIPVIQPLGAVARWQGKSKS